MKKLSFVRKNARRHWVGDGFPVRTIFSYNDVASDLSPFLLMDYGGPTRFEPTSHRRGVGKHPHRGFETVTIVYAGEIEHSDSTGAGGRIGPGDVQWMTAASGVIHEEYHGANFARQGGPFEMIQLWINLPAKDKMNSPAYQEIHADQIPTVELGEGSRARIIAGEWSSTSTQVVRGPARTHTPVDLWDVNVSVGETIFLPVREGHNTGIFVLQGAIHTGDAETGTHLGEAELGVFGNDESGIEIRAEQNSRLLVMSGQPLGEPIVGYGPFVMNSEQEILQALRDFS